MSRIQVGHRGLMACLAVTLIAVLPTHGQAWREFYPMSSPPPPFVDDPVEPPPRCCVPSAITPPAMMGCASPCDGSADCSGDISEGEYTSAYCIEQPVPLVGWCGRSGESIYVPAYVCMASECTINGEPGEECRWIILFGGGWSGIGLKCAMGATICN